MVGIYLARTLISDIEKVKFSYWSYTCTGRSLHQVLLDQVSDVPSSSVTLLYLPSLLVITSLFFWWSRCYGNWKHGVLLNVWSPQSPESVKDLITLCWTSCGLQGCVRMWRSVDVFMFCHWELLLPAYVWLLSTRLPSLFLQFNNEQKLQLQAFFYCLNPLCECLLNRCDLWPDWLFTVQCLLHHHHHHCHQVFCSCFLVSEHHVTRPEIIVLIIDYSIFSVNQWIIQSWHHHVINDQFLMFCCVQNQRDSVYCDIRAVYHLINYWND